MRTHPFRTVDLFARKLWTLFLPFSKTLVTNPDTTLLKKTVATAAYLPILAFAMLGLWSSAGRTRGLWVIHALLLSIAATYALLTACTRCRTRPVPVLFAAAAIIPLGGGRGNALERVSGRPRRTSAPVRECLPSCCRWSRSRSAIARALTRADR
jgi:hypothetical protein